MTGPDHEDPVVAPHTTEEVNAIQSVDESLAARVEGLRQVLADLSPDVARLQSEQKTVWYWLKGGAGFIAFDVFITIVGLIFGIYLHHVQSNNESLLAQVQHNQDRLNTSIHETCNLYGLFLKFYNPAAGARFAQGPMAYDQAYTELQRSADNLQCGFKHIVPGT